MNKRKRNWGVGAQCRRSTARHTSQTPPHLTLCKFVFMSPFRIVKGSRVVSGFGAMNSTDAVKGPTSGLCGWSVESPTGLLGLSKGLSECVAGNKEQHPRGDHQCPGRRSSHASVNQKQQHEQQPWMDANPNQTCVVATLGT